ncbi:glycine--tRNA ligase [Candidatus Micrarchaeota archaeon]|nr:glycine--tRNA ligase [Candidatus Micrarchaeota archaeon]
MQLHERIFELALQRSFFFPSNEPYGQIAGFYDYGPVGVLLKQKIQNAWRERFVKREGNLELEASLMTPEPVLVASGHVGTFADPVVECQKCKTRFRADHFVEEKHFNVHNIKWDGKLETLDQIIAEKGLKCATCKGDLGKVFMFNLMFKSGIGSESSPAYCRPETAQGTFTAFPRLFRNHGTKLPLAAGQVGRSFRNEISPRKGLVRMREFTQMELEYFFDPLKQDIEGFAKIANEKMTMQIGGTKREMTAQQIVDEKVAPNQIFAYYLVGGWHYYLDMGVDPKRMVYRVLDKTELPHYSKGNIDLEVETSYGSIETIGNAYRTDYDLSQHAKVSGKDMSVHFDGRKIIPHVFEIAMGVDRLFFCMLEHCFRDKDVKDENGNWKLGTAKDWEWFDFPPAIAPYQVAVFPLMKKDGLAEKGEEIAKNLREEGLDILYSESGSIGRRYAKADEIGTPYALTIDYDTLKDGTVTIRYRNDGKQERIKISDLQVTIKDNLRKGRVRL